MAAGQMSEVFRGRQAFSGAIFVGLAVVGLVTSLGISRVPAANPAKRFLANFLTDVAAEVVEVRKDRVLWLAVLGNVYFWFLGALLQPVILIYGTEVLHLR